MTVVNQIIEEVEKGLPESEYLLIDWEVFQQDHTLHDSYWEHFWIDTHRDAQIYAIINWDHVWHPNEKSMDVNGAYLLMRFDSAESIKFDGYKAHSEYIHNCIGDARLDGDVLTIESIANGQIIISPVQEVSLILYDSNGEKCKIMATQQYNSNAEPSGDGSADR